MVCDESCPAKLWCAVSGGKDSVTAAHLLASQDKLAGILFIDTGIAVPDLLPFIYRLVDAQGWELEVYRTPVEYDDWVMRYGFPGPAQHGAVMNALKGRALRTFKKNHPGEHVASGVRMAESRRRALHTQAHGTFERVPMHAVISDWSTASVWEYVRKNDLPRSPAYNTLHISGDCCCGSFSERDEVHLIEMFYPELADRLHRLEERVAACGKIRNRLSRKWGGGRGGSGFVSSRKNSKLEAFFCQSCELDRAQVQNP